MALSLARRHFILSMLAALAPVSMLGFAWTHFPAARRAALEGLLSDIEGARAIGSRYLELVPEECDCARLADELFADTIGRPAPPVEFDQVRQTLAARRERDFASGDTVIIGGWIVARTEARLCALAALA